MNHFSLFDVSNLQQGPLCQPTPQRSSAGTDIEPLLRRVNPQQCYDSPARSAAQSTSALRSPNSYTQTLTSEVWATPSKSDLNEPSNSEKSLLRALGRPELIPFSKVMNEVFGPSGWAFTGSVALTLHAQALNQEHSLVARVPGDVDILVDPRKAQKISLMSGVVSKCISNLEGQNACRNYSSFEFQVPGGEKLSVDQLSNPKFGDLDGVESISGIRVVTLAELQARKEAICSQLQMDHEFEALTESSKGSEPFELLEKTMGDLEWISELRQLSAAYALCELNSDQRATDKGGYKRTRTEDSGEALLPTFSFNRPPLTPPLGDTDSVASSSVGSIAGSEVEVGYEADTTKRKLW